MKLAERNVDNCERETDEGKGRRKKKKKITKK